MRYVEGSWHRPYGAQADEDEGLGFSHGDGAVTGGIEGSLVWANYPRRRQDGVWTPNLRGRIAAHDGNEILLSIHGLSILEQGPRIPSRDPRAGRADDRSRAAPMAQHLLPRRRGRDRRGAGTLVAGDLRLRERAGTGPARARSGTARAVPPAHGSVVAAASTSARVTSTIPSRSATAMCSSGVWICAMPFARFRQASPRALKTFASAPPPLRE